MGNFFSPNPPDVPQEDSDSEKPLPSVFEPPTSTVCYIAWLLGLPVIITLYCTVPDCRKAGLWRRCYPVTFVLSALWMAGLSYVLYWMIVVIGDQYKLSTSITYLQCIIVFWVVWLVN